MPLTTAKFDTLRDRNERDFDAIAYQPGVAIDRGTASRRRRIHTLLQRRADLEDLASTQSQREEYGVEQWHEEFVRMRDLIAYPNTQLEGDALRQHVWSTLPNSRFKRFQEAFSQPHQWIVPAFTMSTGNYVQWNGRQDFNAMSLDPCLVSADRIPEKLAKDLGLADFEDDNDKPYDRLKKKADMPSIKKLKEIWESTTPLQTRNHRLLRINSDVPATNGRILYTREEENGTEEVRNGDAPTQRTVQFFDSAYGALRKTHHERHLYSREMDMLTTLQIDAADLAVLLDHDWRKDTPDDEKEQMRERTQELVRRTKELLHSDAWENKYKVKANDLLSAIKNLQDKSGKTNVSACLAKLVAANSRLRERLDEMQPKSGYNEQDQMVLERATQTHEKGIRGFRDNVEQNAPALHDRLQLFGQSELTQSQIDAQASGILGKLKFKPTDLKNITLHPFATYAARLNEKYEQLSTAVYSRDLTTAQQTIVQMHLIGKFQAVHTCFERTKQYMIEGEHLPISRIRVFVSQLYALFSTFQVYPDVTVESYQQPFEKMQSDLEGIKNRLRHYERQDIDVSERTQIYKDLKDYLDTFNLEKIVGGLA